MRCLIYSFIFIFVVGCNEKPSKHARLDTIKIFNNDTAHYEGVFKKTETILLETNNNCLISKISQLDFFSGKIFVLDQNTKNIFIFDSKGHFLNRIGSIGKGPGEFIRPLQFILNRKDSILKIYDSAQKKILFYNFCGKFINEIYLNKFLSSFGEWNNGSGYWGYCAGDLNEDTRKKQKETIKFFKFNSTGQEINSYEGSKVVDNLYLKDCYITSEYNDQIFFVEPYSDKIYSFDGKKITYEYNIDFSGKFIPQRLLTRIQKMNSKEYSNVKEINELLNSYIFFFVRFFENDNWIYTFSPFKGTSTLYNKVNKKALTFHKQLFKGNSYETFFWPLLLSENKMYSAPNPSQLFDLLKDDNVHKYSSERNYSLKRFLKDVKESDNPIIFIYELNK